jgi:hypothetical protein
MQLATSTDPSTTINPKPKAFNEICDRLTREILAELATTYEMPQEALDWVKKMIDYNVKGGKLNRGLTVRACGAGGREGWMKEYGWMGGWMDGIESINAAIRNASPRSQLLASISLNPPTTYHHFTHGNTTQYNTTTHRSCP